MKKTREAFPPWRNLDLNRIIGIFMNDIRALLETPSFHDVIEWTFLYDALSRSEKNPYNSTLFEGIGGVPYELWKKGRWDHRSLLEKCGNTLSLWIEYMEWMREGLSRIEREGMESMIFSLRMALLSLPIELEKAMGREIVSTDERYYRVQEIESYQTILYGPKVSSSRDESEKTLERMRKIWRSGQNNLSPHKKQLYIWFYEKLEDTLFHIQWASSWLKESGQLTSEWCRHRFTEKVLHEYGHTPLSRSSYMILFQVYIYILWLRQTVRINAHVSSIYDGTAFLEIPSIDEYATMSLEDILCLMMHEIGTHYVNQEISQREGLFIRWKGNTEKDEWLAIIMEHLFLWHHFEDMYGVGWSYPSILVAELFAEKERREYIALKGEMQKMKWEDSVITHDLRIMRWYPFSWPWCPRKDTVYTRWKAKILSAIESGKYELVDFFSGKIGIDESISRKIDNTSSKKERFLPFLFPDFILFSLWNHGVFPDQDTFSHFVYEKYEHAIRKDDLTAMSDLRNLKEKTRTWVHTWVEEIRKNAWENKHDNSTLV